MAFFSSFVNIMYLLNTNMAKYFYHKTLKHLVFRSFFMIRSISKHFDYTYKTV